MSANPYKKQVYIQRFRKEWLLDPELWSWLVEVPKINGGSGAECKFCGVYLHVKYHDLKNHARTKKHKANEAKAPKGQLLRISRPVERTDDDESIDVTAAEEDDLSYSVHEIQPGEFVVQKSESFLNETSKTTLLNNSTASGDYDFGDLIRFDVNDSSGPKPTSNIPYSYLGEKYFEFYEAKDRNKLTYNCKLCSPMRAVKANRQSLYNLKCHIRTTHWDHYDEFIDCIKANITRGRPKGLTNPFPDLEKYFVFKKELSVKTKPTFECKLCSPIDTIRDDRTVKCSRGNPAKLELHIRLYHSSLYDEFKRCLETNARSLKQKRLDKLHAQSTTPSDKNESNEWRNTPNSSKRRRTTDIDFELPKTRCKKLELDISDTDEALYDDDVADPDFEPQSPGSPDDAIDEDEVPARDLDEVPASRNSNNRSDLIDIISNKKSFVRSPVFQSTLGYELKRFEPLFDRVLVEKDDSFSPILMKDGILIPPSNNKARVVAVGKGIRNESGQMIPLEVSVGDEVIIPEYGATKIELDGNSYLLFQDSDLLAKFKSK